MGPAGTHSRRALFHQIRLLASSLTTSATVPGNQIEQFGQIRSSAVAEVAALAQFGARASMT